MSIMGITSQFQPEMSKKLFSFSLDEYQELDGLLNLGDDL